MIGWMYILECSDGSYYTGSANNLELRFQQHQNGEGANHTKKRLPVRLLYFEEFQRIDEAFYREKQAQGWSRKKKEALILGFHEKLPELSKNYTQYRGDVVSTSSTTEKTTSSTTEKTTCPTTKKTTSSTTEKTTSPTTNINPLPEPVEGNTQKLKS